MAIARFQNQGLEGSKPTWGAGSHGGDGGRIRENAELGSRQAWLHRREVEWLGLKVIGSLDLRYSDAQPPKVATLFAPKGQPHTSPGQRPGLRWEISVLSPERAAQAADATYSPALSGRSDSIVSATQGVALG